MENLKYKNLFNVAIKAREYSCAIYSKFKVGAAIKTKGGKIYFGSNIESSSYGLSICAERVALFKALSEGEREFTEILITAEGESVCRPCGACRQLLYDYAPKITVVMTNLTGEIEIQKIIDLLNNPFSLK